MTIHRELSLEALEDEREMKSIQSNDPFTLLRLHSPVLCDIVFIYILHCGMSSALYLLALDGVSDLRLPGRYVREWFYAPHPSLALSSFAQDLMMLDVSSQIISMFGHHHAARLSSNACHILGQIWSNITELNKQMGRDDAPFTLDF